MDIICLKVNTFFLLIDWSDFLYFYIHFHTHSGLLVKEKKAMLAHVRGRIVHLHTGLFKLEAMRFLADDEQQELGH